MKNKSRRIRRSVQLAFLVLIALIAVNHSLVENGMGLPLLSGASLHAVCPFGGVVSLYQLVTSGTFVQKIHESNIVLMVIVFASAILIGPVFCSWICPFGTFQELLGKIGKKIWKKRYNHFIPPKVDKVLRYLRYILLGLVLFNTARSGHLMFSTIDPYFALFQFWTGEVAITALVILGLIILLSLFVERPFCKYACPYGAVLGITNLFRIIPLRRRESSCINCKACDRACPMNIEPSSTSQTRNHQCISCFECTSEDGACPVSDTLTFQISKNVEEEK